MKISTRLTFISLCISYSLFFFQPKLILAQTKTEKNKYNLPKHIKNSNNVLLVQLKGRKNYDRYIIKHMKNEYSGKYEFLEVESISKYYGDYPSIQRDGFTIYYFRDNPKFEGKYEDVEKYRYFLGQYYIATNGAWRFPGKKSEVYTRFKSHFYILDRKTGEKYDYTQPGNSFAKFFKKYITAIDEGV